MILNFFLKSLKTVNNVNITGRILNYSTNLSVKDVCNGKIGDAVQVQGWITSLRKMKENIFLDINDGSCEGKLQIVIASDLRRKELTKGSPVTVRGVLNKSPRGDLELHANSLEVYGFCNVLDGYPIAPKESYPPEYIRQYLHLRPRTSKFSSLLRVRDGLQCSITKYLHENGYIQIHTPVLTSNDCEGAGETFKITIDNEQMLKEMAKQNVNTDDAYFDKKVYLTVSGQLHLEAAAHGIHKVYTFGPTFRAENSNTRLHLAEFYMLELEKAFTNDLNDLTNGVEDLLKNVTEDVLTRYGDDIKKCRDVELDMSWLRKKFVILDYEEAVRIVKEKNDFKVRFNQRRGFSKEHELYLVDYNDGAPTFIVNWPRDIKPFYMKECNDDPTKVAAFDLLTPIVGELVGGSLREDDYDKLKDRIPKEMLNNLDWYLDLRKFGGCPTGGFGLGFERYLILLLGINNIKDTIPYPRWPHNCNL